MTPEEMEARVSELEKARESLEEDMNNIRGQIDAAHARHVEGRHALDETWHAKAKTALRYKGSEHQRLLREIGELRRKLKAVAHEKVMAATPAPFSRYFYQVAAQELPDALFQTLKGKAMAMKEASA